MRSKSLNGRGNEASIVIRQALNETGIQTQTLQRMTLDQQLQAIWTVKRIKPHQMLISFLL